MREYSKEEHRCHACGEETCINTCGFCEACWLKYAHLRVEKDVFEALAALEHEQWMQWATAVIGEVSVSRAKRWDRYMVPYSELTEEVKEEDRKWAHKVLKILGK